MPEIKDVINTKHDQTFVVLDEMPKFLYEKKGELLFASDGGFYNTYFYDSPGPNWKAFAGRKFQIPMKDGTFIDAYGQWWDGRHQETAPEPIVPVGISTLDKLHNCYVFIGTHISKKKLDEWLEHNVASDNYWKYDKRKNA